MGLKKMKQETKEQLKEAWKSGMLYRFYAWLSSNKRKKASEEVLECEKKGLENCKEAKNNGNSRM